MSIDVNKPVENPELLAELRRRGSIGDDRQAQINLMNNIMQMVATRATFLAIIRMDTSNALPEGDGKMTLQKDTEIQVQMIGSADGKVYLPLFTDWPSLRMWEAFREGQVQTLILTFDDVMGFINDSTSGIVINPFSENLCITSPQLMHMKQVKEQAMEQANNQQPGIKTQVVNEPTQVKIADPEKYPQDMVDAIKNHAATDTRIRAIHVKLMNKNGEMSFLLVVDMVADSDREMNEVFSGIAMAGRDYVPAGMFLEMVPLSSEFGQQVLKVTRKNPIYTR